MIVDPKIKIAFNRISRAFAQRPEFGIGTRTSKTVIRDGLTCEIREGNWSLIADMPENAGGNAVGPSPGVFGRAALGSCLAIGYMLWAAAKDIPIAGLEVEIEADFDDGVLFGTAADLTPGYRAVRYTVTVDSEAPEQTIMQLLDDADKLSPYLGIFRLQQQCKRTVNIVSSKQI